MFKFNVLGVIERQDEYGNAYTNVRVSIEAKAWHRAKRQGQLGMLYGVDISNAVHRSHGVPAYNPTVSDKERARNGIKYVTLTYYAVKPQYALTSLGIRRAPQGNAVKSIDSHTERERHALARRGEFKLIQGGKA